MKLYIYDSAYRLEGYDEGDFCDYSDYLQNIVNIINCFIDDSVIVFPIEEHFFNDEEYEINRSFIRDRIILTNKVWICNTPLFSDECPNIIWYIVRSNEELIDALKIEQNFNCALIPNNCIIEEATYILNSNEDDEFNSLSIREKNKGDFLHKVLPKLEFYFKKKIEIVHLF
ncbi:hypothetical protein [Desnuesiella massiliensis]|uniref:hypothetical protein n=1 Tax=Desnuesiella massiliensis TaxID=1650662 RepID=UPI0006E411DA|nr:hypothetical protein [Desnuesiella massiliensis]